MSQATEAFIDRLIGAVPQLQPLREKHVEGNFGELLPHVLMGEITAEAVELYVRGDQGTVRRLLDFLETEAEAGHEGDVDELIAVSFVENLPYDGEPGHAITGELGPRLSEILRLQRQP